MTAPVSPPLLREGDRLTGDEFMSRWEAMPDLEHAELIDGIVYLSSPLSYPHSRFHHMLSGWLAIDEFATPGCEGGSQGTWLMTDRDFPQPDTTLRIVPESGGQSRISGEYTAGAPELVAEVAVSSRARDLGVKCKLYERMDVHEYIVAITRTEKLLWSELSDGRFQPLDPGSDGVIRSRCFPGLWLDPAALWKNDRARLATVLQQGLASAEHAAFAARLARKLPSDPLK